MEFLDLGFTIKESPYLKSPDLRNAEVITEFYKPTTSFTQVLSFHNSGELWYENSRLEKCRSNYRILQANNIIHPGAFLSQFWRVVVQKVTETITFY